MHVGEIARIKHPVRLDGPVKHIQDAIRDSGRRPTAGYEVHGPRTEVLAKAPTRNQFFYRRFNPIRMAEHSRRVRSDALQTPELVEGITPYNCGPAIGGGLGRKAGHRRIRVQLVNYKIGALDSIQHGLMRHSVEYFELDGDPPILKGPDCLF